MKFNLAEFYTHTYQCSKDPQDQFAQCLYIDFDETCV